MQWYSTVLSLGTFFGAIFAVVLGFQLYALLKTGAIGQTWRVIIVASVIYGIKEMLHFAEVWELLDPAALQSGQEVAGFCFIVLMTVALYLQRRAFFKPHLFRFSEEKGEKGYPSRFERLRHPDAMSDEWGEPLGDDEDDDVQVVER